jgi:hypothetical protein
MLDYAYLPPESPDARDEAATIEAMHIGYANGWIAPAAPAPARLAAIPSPAVTEVQRLKAVVATLTDERNAARGQVDAARADLDLVAGWLDAVTNGLSVQELAQLADVAAEVRGRWGLAE